MIKLGVIGLNEGNGHPFSYSAIFNGFDPLELAKRCPFALIKEYLPRDHRNEIFIDSAKVTHVWTQDPRLSEDVSKVCLIPNIVKNYTDMIGKVDAILLARDDPENHLEFAKPFLQKGLPIFIDKQLTSTAKDFDALLGLLGKNYPLMAGSPVRFCREVESAKAKKVWTKVKSIHGMSRVNWMRYGHHVLEGIACIWGLDIHSVRSLSDEVDHDIIQIRYVSGMNVILEFIKNVALPIQFTCFSEVEESFTIPFTDFFHSFRQMLLQFTHMVETGKPPIPFEEIVGIAKVILAGDISKHNDGVEISPVTLRPIT
jgi:predicted dehydrogenase